MKHEKSRIDLLINKLEISQSEFAEKLGITPNAVTNYKKRDLGANAIKKIIDAFPKVNPTWLMTGEGDMFTTEIVGGVEEIPHSSGVASKHLRNSLARTKGKPYFNVDFEMGYDLMVNDQTTNADYMIDFEPYNKCDCWCNARGNSMFPTISNGDVIAIKEIKDPSCLISGEIYAIVTTNDLRTIKRVKDNGDSLTLIPDNKEYPEQTISKKMILRIFRVLGSMKVF